MSVVPAPRSLRLLSVAAGIPLLLSLGTTRAAGARVFPEVGTEPALFAATAVTAPLVSLTVAPSVAPNAPVTATATALAPLSSIAVGYCPGFTCSAAFATQFASAPGG